MPLGSEINVIGDFFKLHHIENPGLAFGIDINFKYGKLFLTSFRLAASFFIGYYLYTLVSKKANNLLILAISMILAGAIGNVIDTSNDYPGTILAAAIWHMEATIDKAVSQVASGSFEAADYGQYSFMEFGGGSMVLDESLVPADVVSAVKAKEAQILDGSFKVSVNDDAPASDN